MQFFENHLPLLERVIHGKGAFQGKLSNHIVEQLRLIYSVTEEAWYENIKRFHPEKKVKYLLIGEAPPWTFYNEPSYFYLQPSGTLFNSVFFAFKCAKYSKDRARAYDYLAERGFLLIDSLPYAFPFSSKQRKSEAYKDLISVSVPWWQDKLSTCGLEFSSELKVAFGFRMNGLVLMEALNNKIGDQKIALTDSHIVAYPKSHFPTAAEIKRVFFSTH